MNLERVWHGALWREIPAPVVTISRRHQSKPAISQQERIADLMQDGTARRPCEVQRMLGTTPGATTKALVALEAKGVLRSWCPTPSARIFQVAAAPRKAQERRTDGGR